MLTVLLVGTNHKYQRETPGVLANEIDDFREYLRQAVAANGVAAIAEEMSIAALAENGLYNSVAQGVASQLSILHDLADPSPEERDRLGIQQRNEIELAGHFADKDQCEIEAEVRQSYDIREEYWASRLSSMGTYPVLFICGAAHVNSFQDKLLVLGHDVIVLTENWVPRAGA